LRQETVNLLLGQDSPSWLYLLNVPSDGVLCMANNSPEQQLIHGDKFVRYIGVIIQDFNRLFPDYLNRSLCVLL